MLAVIKTGGRQYKVSEGQLLSVEKLSALPGDQICITDVLLVNNEGKVIVGTPVVSNAKVMATVIDQKRTKKILVFKKSRRKNFRRKNGHRQPFSVLKIDSISI